MGTRELRTARVTTLVEPKLAEKLERLAQASDRSVSAEARHALKAYVNAKETR